MTTPDLARPAGRRVAAVACTVVAVVAVTLGMLLVLTDIGPGHRLLWPTGPHPTAPSPGPAPSPVSTPTVVAV